MCVALLCGCVVCGCGSACDVCGVVCGVWCVSLWMSLWSWCVCGVCGTLKNPVRRLQTPPCAHSKRPRVCQQHGHMLDNLCACCQRTRRRFEWTHGRSSPVLITKKSARRVLTWSQRFTKEILGCYHFQFEKRSRTTCSRLLQSFAFPDKIVQLQLSWGTLRRESATGWFGLSLAPFSKHDERFARQYRYSTK